MSTTYEIPLSAQQQTFRVQLAGITYRLSVRWNGMQGIWFIDIDTDAGAPIVHGIPMITGADLLGQYQHLGLGGGLYVLTDGDPDALPTYDGLGTASKLYFVMP